LGLLIGARAKSGSTASVQEVALVAGLSIAFITLVIDEHGAANLNPQI
jgi:hypothetical protein